MSGYLRFQSRVAAGLKLVGLYHPVRDFLRTRRFAARSRREITSWVEAGRPNPPPAAIKHAEIRRFARAYKAQTLVKTGTFYGDAIFELRRTFRTIHSIELAPCLHHLAARELGHFSHIHLHLRDSAQILPFLLPNLYGPIVFWLDGHFCSGPSARGDRDTPVFAELDCVLGRPAGQDVVLIDDARLFDGQNDYPTLATLQRLFAQWRPAARLAVENDIISACPI